MSLSELITYDENNILDASVYANERYKLAILNKLIVDYPHLTSWLKVEIVQADPFKDYYWPPSFQKKAIKVNISITERLCYKSSCSTALPDRTCNSSSTVQNVRIGDGTQYESRCQPSCYYFRKNVEIDEDGEEQVQFLQTKWDPDNNRCLLVPPAVAWFQHPFYRSSDRYAVRQNDMPLGFSKTFTSTNSQFSYTKESYTYNKYYCDVYLDPYDPVNEVCKQPVWLIIVNAIVGEALIKTSRAQIQHWKTGSSLPLPPNLPPLPPPDELYQLDNWLKDVNKDFVCPPEDYELPELSVNEINDIFNKPETEDTEEKSYFSYEKVHKVLKRMVRSLDNTKDIFEAKTEEQMEIMKQRMVNMFREMLQKCVTNCGNTKKIQELIENEIIDMRKELPDLSDAVLSDAAKCNEYLNRKIKKACKKIKKNPKINEKDFEILDVPKYITNLVKDILLGIMESVFSEEFWRDQLINGIFERIIFNSIKKFFRTTVVKVIEKLTVTMSKFAAAIFSNVLKASLRSWLIKFVTNQLISIAGKLALFLASVFAAITTIIGILLLLAMFVDFIFMFWDPYKFNTKYPRDLMDEIHANMEQEFRINNGVKVPVMDFNILAVSLLTKEELTNLSLTTFSYIYDYLNNLVVNSSGSVIDKGIPLINAYIGQQNKDEIIVKTKLLKPRELYEYEYNHSTRQTYFKKTLTASIILTGISFALLYARLYFAVMLILLTVILLMFSNYWNVEFNLGKVFERINFIL